LLVADEKNHAGTERRDIDPNGEVDGSKPPISLGQSSGKPLFLTMAEISVPKVSGTL
jgi:hypothetical protein